MKADDPRHGTNAGYIAGCRCSPCRTGSRRYGKKLKADKEGGLERTVESWRAVRRLEALACLGWSRGAVAEAMGVKHKCQVYEIGQHERIYASTLARLDVAYRRLSMQLPNPQTTAERTGVTKTQRNAQRRGALPPMAWDDIDDANENPDLTAPDHTPDPVVIDRILGGDMSLARSATRAERVEVVRRWAGSANELERLTGWQPQRYRSEDVA